MIDDVGVSEAGAVVADGAAEPTEDVAALAGASFGNPAREVVDHELTADEAAVELEAGDAQADARHRRSDQVLEDVVHLRRLRPELDADEDRRRDVERQHLERSERMERRRLSAPYGLAALDHGVHALEVLAERRARERLVHDLAMLLVLVAVAQEQAVGEDPAHDHHPRLPGGEDAIAVEEHQAVGVGTEEVDHLERPDVQRHHRAALRVHPLQAREHVDALPLPAEHGAQGRPATGTRNVRAGPRRGQSACGAGVGHAIPYAAQRQTSTSRDPRSRRRPRAGADSWQTDCKP